MNKRTLVGMITIGQSPREDLVPEMKQLIGIGAKIYERGVLDGLSLLEIEKLAPALGEYVLVSRLRDGSPVRLARGKIIGRVQQCIASLVGQGMDLIVVLCTGEWPKLNSPKLVVTPAEPFCSFTLGLVDKGDKLGIIVPAEDQIEVAERKWSRKEVKLCIAAAPLYSLATSSELTRVAKSFKESGIDLVAMDCVGYTLENKRIVQQVTGKPVVLVRSVIASIVRELIG